MRAEHGCWPKHALWLQQLKLSWRNSASPMPDTSWRGQRTTAERGYGAKWQAARVAYLQANPTCVMCAPRIVPASVVDHKTPHRGDMSLFWSRSNWQSLCRTCHNGRKQQLERSGTVRGFDADGNPLDPNHHWTRVA